VGEQVPRAWHVRHVENMHQGILFRAMTIHVAQDLSSLQGRVFTRLSHAIDSRVVNGDL